MLYLILTFFAVGFVRTHLHKQAGYVQSTWCGLRVCEIVDAQGLYLRQYRLFDWKWVCVRVHYIAREDADRHLHDHPWAWAWSFILRGQYLEQRDEGMRWRRAGQTNILRSREYHRIRAVAPSTWTLFVTGPRTKSWGFLTPDGHMDWKEYGYK
jgi:hypothetical protein